MNIIIKTKKSLYLSNWKVEIKGKIVPEVEQYYLCFYNNTGTWEGLIFDTKERMDEAFNFIVEEVKKDIDFIDISRFERPDEITILS